MAIRPYALYEDRWNYITPKLTDLILFAHNRNIFVEFGMI